MCSRESRATTRHLPDMDKHQQYQKVFTMYRSLYLKLKDSFAEMDVMNAK